MSGDDVGHRAAIAREFDPGPRAAARVLDPASDDDLARRSAGTRRSNEELLFHTVLGYIVTRLLVVVCVVSRLPDRDGRGFAALPNAPSPGFHVIDYWTSRAGARVYDRHRMTVQFVRVTARLQRRLEHATESDLAGGMAYPTRRDPHFRDYLTAADLYRYPRRHVDHHRRRLGLPTQS